ncbi:hypothetical protein SAMN05216390_102324 [Lachnospiraceae bacterium KH1T2]|nr:hypothetical protein SAMN05216390_102324 [Lachnospiraceae bacterium KH1T2]
MTFDYKLNPRYILKGLGAAWCIVTSYLTPVWLTMAFLCLSGKIGMYGYSVKNGSAFRVGLLYLITWLLFGLLADIIILLKGYAESKYRKWIIVMMAVSVLYFFFISNFNSVNFVATIVG